MTAVLRMLLAVSRRKVAALAVVVLVQALAPVAAVVAVGHLLGAVVALRTDPGAPGRAWLAFALLAAAWLADQLAQFAGAALTARLSRLVAEHITGAVLAASLHPVGIGHLEDPARADQFSLAQGLGAGSFPPAAAVAALTQVAVIRLQALATAVTLASVLWWAPLPLILGWVLLGRRVAGQLREQVRAVQAETAALRQATYFRTLGLDLGAAKEVRVFGLGGWLADRFTACWQAGMGELLRRRDSRLPLAWRTALLVGSYAAVLTVLVDATLAGRVSITGLTIAIPAAIAMSGFGWSGDPQWTLAGAAPAIQQALALSEPAPPRAGRDPDGPRVGIRFEDVSFGYPGRPDRPADRLNLCIPAGQSLAIVGANGAGKTTLIKLLARLYEPAAGRITVDDVDLRELDAAGWRRQLAIVFQDFLRLELTARDNVACGRSGTPVDEAALAAAASAAGAADLIATLPQGWDTVLSRRFGDTELSGGQWQKLALARALYAVRLGARVLVLDEPTAQLDAAAEAELYARYLELTRGLTTVLVSHRFNTVRLADRIVVLAGGRIVEDGSHDELIRAGDWYARMFRLQADRLAAST